ncbi:hypothetical protein TRICI_004776 [Trichomonascus ciferrii]|uniref:Alcohol acetyltransferase n=1 Tax=Trichomonascus ciferrii TaxID=44093 RepID=A0A642UZE8_9ASCO|nr:hypothetical protein TRICI_004776 [Trichomonascus ciferrii]
MVACERSCGENDMGMSSVIFVSATFTQVLDKERLHEALGKLVDEEPILRCNVFGVKDSSPYFGCIDVDLDKVILYRPDITSCQELSDLLIPGEKYEYGDEHMPLWRAYVIGEDGKELAWVYDHCISDGTSGVLFHQKLLRIMNNGKVSNKKPDEAKIGPCLEDAIDIRPSWGFSLQFASSMLKKKLFGGPKTWTGPPPVIPMQSQSELFEFDSEFSAQLLAYCRRHQITLTSLLYGAFLQSLRHIIPDEDQQTYDDISFCCPVNARKYNTALSDELGNYVFQFSHKAPLKDNKTINEEAKEILPALKAALADPAEIKYVIGLLGYVNIRNYLNDEFKVQNRSGAMEISNLGSFDFSSNPDQINISKLMFTQGVNSLSCYTTLSLVGVKNGPICGSISVGRDDSNHSICKTLLNEVFQRLHNLLQSE